MNATTTASADGTTAARGTASAAAGDPPPRGIVRKPGAQPVYLIEVAAVPGQRTRAAGVLWDGVLNSTPDDDIDGPSPIESLLAALAGCLARNLRSTADSAHIVLDRVELRVAATRSDDPPAVTSVVVDAEISSTSSSERVRRVVELALRYGTITRTLARACPLEIRLRVNGTPLDLPVAALFAERTKGRIPMSARLPAKTRE